ncbi:cytochrome P450 family protein [Geodermatophilus sabuli]|uniref:Cytochrome P450 n=1 Tax=Geodermatophilus sabuli TaxID=1564158 RepID=A0A285EHL6_9ACTN|nr:cytochrome P450 [Geodermatophilus sabuli]MBB3083961.1 cytochrome P450 [Geodermatophilus sabuli]SNX98609.1 Cytochrome P450 [Geodermatophilus sabuli]
MEHGRSGAARTAGTVVELDAAFFADPYALYARLRAEDPVARGRTPVGLPVWLVTRYDDARAALNDPRLAKDAAGFARVLERHPLPAERRTVFAQELSRHMLSSDPPDHTRLRKLVSRAFTMRAIAGMRPRIEAIATELADRMAAGPPEVDLLDAFAFPLPMSVICDLLGVPDAERGTFRRWSNTLLSSDGDAAARTAAGAAMAQYLTALVAEKRARPADDMLSAIVAASADADQLSADETVAMAFLLLVAGHETTVNLIGNGVLALLRRPDRLAELRADPELVPRAVEEFLRFDGPVNLATFRHTTEDVEIGGVPIPAGEVVLVALASADHDPDHYPSAEDLDLHRDASGHLAFGFGLHHCLGAPLARLEGEVAFRTLLARFPDLALAVEPDQLSWRASILMRGLTRLPVRLRDTAGPGPG